MTLLWFFVICFDSRTLFFPCCDIACVPIKILKIILHKVVLKDERKMMKENLYENVTNVAIFEKR